MRNIKTIKPFRFISVILIALIFITGCGRADSNTDEPAGTDAEPVIENISTNQEGHYSFRPHVFGSRYLEQFGEETRDAFFVYCDAMRSGEDTFACPDQDTLDWCIGRIAHFFFPVGAEYVEYGTCEDGMATIEYKIPKEEFIQKEKDFEEAITDILNDCLGDDYSDLEKILALYEYMTTQYTYDYEMFEHSLDWMDKQGTYRCLMEKTGICNEIASLYNYLLLQVGIDSEEIAGFSYTPEGPGDAHSWVFVNLDGESYHIDPTYGLTVDRPQLCFFMMTDEIREDRDQYPRKDYSLAAMGDQSRDFFTFEAVSDKYSALWEGEYIGMDRSSHEIVYRDMNGEMKRFSYDA